MLTTLLPSRATRADLRFAGRAGVGLVALGAGCIVAGFLSLVSGLLDPSTALGLFLCAPAFLVLAVGSGFHVDCVRDAAMRKLRGMGFYALEFSASAGLATRHITPAAPPPDFPDPRNERPIDLMSMGS